MNKISGGGARRKSIFDSVRALFGRKFNQSDVGRIDRAIDRAESGQDGGSNSQRLGKLSEQYESGGRGPGTVSTGRGDPGGVSYGIYQLASRTGTAAKFAVGEGARWASELGAGPPGSREFSESWRRIAAREPEAFAQAQHAFIERTHYRPAVDAVRRRTGLDLDVRHAAVRDATWSVSVQHGGAAAILVDAVEQTDFEYARTAPIYDRKLVEAIYAKRTAYVLGVAKRSGAGARRTLQSITRNRYPAELAGALAMFPPAGANA